MADHQIDLITERFQLLADWPRLGRSRNELRRGLRGHITGNWVIFYRIQRRDVVILRVLHSRRDLTAVLGKQ